MADELISDGWKVTVLDNLITGKRENLEHLSNDPSLRFVEGDVSDKVLLKKLLEGIDAVFHFAAMVSVPLSIEKPEECHLNNVTAFSDLIIALKDMKIPLIYASSAAVYGNRSEGLRHEGEIPLPMSPYGASKAINEIQACSAARVWGLDCVGFRFFNVYGPNEYHKGKMASVVCHLYPVAKTGKPAVLFKSHHPDYPDGGQLRDFVWVEDCVEVILWLLQTPRVSGLFNCGTGKARSFADLAGAVFHALGRDAAIEYVPTPEAIRDKYQYFTEADITRLRDAGFKRPFTGLEEGITRYVQDFLDTADPYR